MSVQGLVKKVSNQLAILWPAYGISDFGRKVVEQPRELPVFWIDVEEEFTDTQGRVYLLNSKVIFSASPILVDTQEEPLLNKDGTPYEIKIGDYLLQGTLSGLQSLDQPLLNPGAREIMHYKKVPDFKGKSFVRIAKV